MFQRGGAIVVGGAHAARNAAVKFIDHDQARIGFCQFGE
jgi:hypothetical protein